MDTKILRSIASGALFGASLTAAGVYSPAVIIGQLHLQDFHMMKSFLTASASSAIAIILAHSLSLTTCTPRSPNSLGLTFLFAPYDGNLLGGALLGLGMALTGACPGTVLPQLATGIPSTPLVLLGSIIGGVLYSKFGKKLQIKVDEKEKDAERTTIYKKFGWSKLNTVLGYEILCLGVVTAAIYFFPGNLHGKEGLVPPVLGGILIGGAQFTSLFLTGDTLGVSRAYEQAGDLLWWGEEGGKGSRPNIKGMAFAVGTLLGSWVLSQVVAIPAPPGREVEVGALRAVVGGVALVFGSRVAGGCTSGHGISGMSQLSISSVVTVAAMFGSGVFFSFVF